jgi:hypothetical protein
MLELYNHTLEHVFLSHLNGALATNRHDSTNSPSALGDHFHLWIFTLPQLFECALESYSVTGKHCPEAWSLGYMEFRKLIYTNPTNAFLSQYGVIVEILTPGLTHDQTVFALRAK